MCAPSTSLEGNGNLAYSTDLARKKERHGGSVKLHAFSLLFSCTGYASLDFYVILDTLNHTCMAGMPRMQAPSVLHSCSHIHAAPGAQHVDSQMGPAPESRPKADPLLVMAVWRPDSSLPAQTERWRASSAGLRGKYSI